MSRMSVAIGALLLLAYPASVGAKDKIDPRITAAMACQSIAQNDERLRCFDRAMVGMRQALESGQLIPADESRVPQALAGVIKATGPMGFNRFWVEMANGDRWELIADSNDPGPRTGTKITLRKGVMGNYWFIDPRWTNRQARYLGRRS